MTNLARSFLEILAIDIPESSSFDIQYSNHSIFDAASIYEMQKSLWCCLSEVLHLSSYRERVKRILRTKIENYATGSENAELEDAEIAEIAAEVKNIAMAEEIEDSAHLEHISKVEDATIAISFSAFQMALIPFSQGLASVLHSFLLLLIDRRCSMKNWSPKELYEDLQKNFKQAVSEECADTWVTLINKRLNKNWKPEEVSKDFQNIFKQQECADVWANYFVGRALIRKTEYAKASARLEKSYAISKSLPAKLYVCDALVDLYAKYEQYRAGLDYCDKLRRSAMELESNDYVFYSLVDSFHFLSQHALLVGRRNFIEAETMLQNIQQQVNQTESVFQGYFFEGMAKSLRAQLIYDQKGSCEEAIVSRKAGLKLLKKVLEDPVYKFKTYIHSPIAPPVTRFSLTQQWITINEKWLSQLSDPTYEDVLQDWKDLIRFESVQNQSLEGILEAFKAFHLHTEGINVTCTDEDGLLSGEGLDKIEGIFNKLFSRKASNDTKLRMLQVFVKSCWHARAYDKAYQWLFKNMKTWSLPCIQIVRHFAIENPNQATAWANTLVQKLYELVQNPSRGGDFEAFKVFRAYTEVIEVTCTDENGLLSREGLDKIEAVFSKFFSQIAPNDLKLTLFVKSCRQARAYDKAYEWLLKNVQTLMEVGFDDNSEARINHFEYLKELVRLLEDTLFASGCYGNMEDAKRAVVWSERSKARDLAYIINNEYGRDTYHDEFCKFDVDDTHAWNEIQNISYLAGPHTAFLVFTKVNDIAINGYFLYAAEEPFLMNMELPRDFATPLGGYLTPLDGLWNKFKNTEFREKIFHCFISSWKRKIENNHILEKLVIVPCEELSTLPFAALYDPKDGKYLIQSYAISYSPSLRLFQHCELLRRKLLCGVPSPRLRALVVGNPTLDRPFLNLPFAEEEGDIVVKALRDACYDGIKLLKKEAATREEVLDGFSSFDWIHMASHAIVDAEHPRGAILLASSIPQEQEEDKTKQEQHDSNPHGKARQEGNSYERAIREHLKSSNSILEPNEIANQERLRARAVILSACNSALGEICADGILGLCRSFHISGVPTIVASLWKVNDEATKILMGRCYENLKTGMEMIFALQGAMRSMIEEPNDFGHSRFEVDDWAPFVVSGTPFTILCESSGEGHA